VFDKGSQVLKQTKSAILLTRLKLSSFMVDKEPLQGGELDQQTGLLLQIQESMFQGAQLEERTPEQAREWMRRSTVFLGWFGATEEKVADVKDVEIPGPAGQIPLRIYTPEGESPFPILVFYHGGGWVIGNLDTQDDLARLLAKRVGCIVVSVDYRLAPEHEFPIGLEDAYTAMRWAVDHAEDIGGEAKRVAVGGDSAGGNFAAVVSLMARDRHDPPPVLQLLINPETDLSNFDTPSHQEFAAMGYGLTRDDVLWFRDHYLKNEIDRYNMYASPLLANNFSNLPPALVVTAEFDVLRDEARLTSANWKKRESRWCACASTG